jgi:pimeloyl-ACP methyl ester carboxylesterase
MRVTAETTSRGVTERHFLVDGVPGVLWCPVGADGSRPLVLLGHGGGGEGKQSPALVARGCRYVTELGFTVAAIDAPGFGERPRSADDLAFIARMRALGQAGPSADYGRQAARYGAEVAARAIPEWRATVDELTAQESCRAGAPVGYFGVSFGSLIGVPLVAAEPRITAAVFGLVGLETLAKAAARITIPVEFLLQWDDELVGRDSALALFDTFASREKTLHANPGRHAEVPAFEVDSSARFFARHPIGTRRAS